MLQNIGIQIVGGQVILFHLVEDTSNTNMNTILYLDAERQKF